MAINVKPYPETGNTYGTVVETRAGETRTGKIVGDVYSAFDDDALWATRGEVILDDDAATYAGDWQPTTGFPAGFIGDGLMFTRDPAATATYDVDLPADGRYDVYARWIGDWGGQNHSNHARNVPITVEHRRGSDTVTVDQDVYSDGWYKLGRYDFDASGRVTVSADGANGSVLTDGVRFVKVADRVPVVGNRMGVFERGRSLFGDRPIFGGGRGGFGGSMLD